MADEAAPPGSPATGRVLFIVNPATRRATQSLIADIRATAPPETPIDIRVSEAPGQATVLARTLGPGCRAVVAVGGDGTVAEVATGLLGRSLPLGVIPAGSTNITARELGIPADPGAAARLIFGPHRLVALDVGRCGDRCFLHIGGAGSDSRLFELTNRDLKRRVGWLAYLPAAIAALRLPPSRFTITTERERITLTAALVLVANGRSVISPGLRLHPDIRSDDGWLDVLIFTATEPVAVARTLARFALLCLEKSPFLSWLRARQVTIEADPPLPVELDGDLGEPTPATFDVLPRALAVIAPLQTTSVP